MICNKALLVITGIGLTIGILSMTLPGSNSERSKSVIAVGKWYKEEMKRFDSMLQSYPTYFIDSSYERRLAKFGELTHQLKKVEGLFVYFHQGIAHETFFLPARFEKRDFGPPLPDNWIILGPFGIDPDSILKKSTKQDSALTKKFIERAVTNFRQVIHAIDFDKDVEMMTEKDLFEALRLEMMRISTIGISNADFVIDQAAMAALEGGMDGWGSMMNLLMSSLPGSMNEQKKQVEDRLIKARETLARKPGYAEFDRLNFLTSYLLPLANDLFSLQKKLGLANNNRFAAINPNVKNIYDAGIFNAEYFASGKDAYSNQARVILGRFLFFDPILSDNNERACALLP